jgi:alkanesulfonate monooxygenase SsuD/methylene tetrahydromethanopterin reductase-like flavin-dependent oxidoreductase (luciferase family)
LPPTFANANGLKFGYFTLSDNRYPNNPRSPEQFLHEIFEQAVYADEIGLNSAWIGEHHFNLLGINPCPNIMLATLASATKRIRLAPAVVLLPVHHPLHVAEEWATLDQLSGGRVEFAAGRGYDRAEFAGFGIPFESSAEHFAEGLDIVWRAWTEPGKWSHHGAFYNFDDIMIRPRPLQSPLRPIVACFSRPTMELTALRDWNIIFAPFAAAMVYGSLKNAVDAYGAECAKHGRAPRQSSCSYFIHIAGDAQEESYGRESLLRYFKDALIAAFPSDAKTVPPSLRYFLDIVKILDKMKAEDLTSKSVLIGSPEKIIADLHEVEASGVSEVILYFNYGMKPHDMVKDQMRRFMRDVAPAFTPASAARSYK